MSKPIMRQAAPRSWAWQESAECRGEDLVLFFGPEGERAPARDVRERKAKAICAQCPARAACLGYALSRPEKYGIYGGLDEDERATERRRRQRRGALSSEPVSRPVGAKIAVTEKACSSCRQVQQDAEFYTDNRAADGLASTCRTCEKKKKQRKREAEQAVAS